MYMCLQVDKLEQSDAMRTEKEEIAEDQPVVLGKQHELRSIHKYCK